MTAKTPIETEPILGFQPSDYLRRIVPEDVARDFSIAPLSATDRDLTVAASHQLSPDELDQFERSVRYPVHLIQVSYLQEKQLYSRLYDKRELRPDPIQPEMLLKRFGIEPHEKWSSELKDLDSIDSTILAEWFQRGWLTNRQWGEIISWLYSLPYALNADANPLNKLTQLISIDPVYRRINQYFIPLWWAKDTLFLGVSDFSRIGEIIAMTDDWHVKRSYVLIPPGLKEKLSSSYDQTTLFAETITEEEIARQLLKDDLISADELNAAKTLRKSAGISLSQALIADRPELEERWLSVFAELRGILAVFDHDLPEDYDHKLVNLFEFLPFELCQLLSALPLNRVEDILVVGLADTHPGVINILEEVSGFKIEPRIMEKETILEWLDEAQQEKPQPAVVGLETAHVRQFLMSANLIQREQLDRLEFYENISIQSFLSRLASEGLIDDDNISQIGGTIYQIPYLSLEQYPLDLGLVNQFSQPFLKEQQLIPLFQNGSDLWVAVADPLKGDSLDQIADQSNCRVWPVLVPKQALENTIKEHISFIPTRKSAPYLEECIDYLIDQNVISPNDNHQIIDAVIEKGQLFDQVIKSFQSDPQADLPQLFADFREVPLISLEPVKQKKKLIDPLGNLVEQTRTQDPVNASVARRLDYETAKRLGALFVDIAEDGIIVAFASPLFDKALADLRRIFQEELYPCLTSREALNAAIERTLGRTNIGTLLMMSGLISRNQLNDALNLAENTNTRLGHALIHRGYITEKQLYTFLSRQADIPLFDLSQVTLSKKAADILTPDEQWERGVIPLSRDEQTVVLGVVDPISRDPIEYIEEKTGLTVKPVLVTENDFEDALEKLYQEHYTAQSVTALLSREPDNSAARVLTKPQKIWMIISLIVIIGLAFWNIKNFLIVLNSIFTIIYMLMIFYKFFLVSAAIGSDLEVPISQKEIDSLRDNELPVYTILIPVYKEAAVLPKLLDSITNLDYPKIKLDVKVLLEEDDEETLTAFREINPPEYIHAVILPPSQPKTKPKACNYGLIHARGEYTVIFDAEDKPDPDQLKRVVVAFNKIPANVICIQCKLNYFNRSQNLLTRWFSIEYSMWFDLFLPGLDARNVPIPLGGTSNHFKKFALIEAGAWDPHNMTEDADLGIRLYKLGYRTKIVDTTTYEEANSKVNNWIRQRSRWVKGYIQTWLVHMRHPIKLIKDIGFPAFFSFQMVVGGNIFTVLLNPVYWILTAAWFLFQFDYISTLFPGPIYYLGAFSLFFGNFVFTYINVAGAMGRKYYDMVWAALISPLYWGLMSIGGWRGFLQLFTKPHYWEKTVHGLGQETDEEEEE